MKLNRYTLSLLFTMLSYYGCVTPRSIIITQRLFKATPQDCMDFVPNIQQEDKPIVAYDAQKVMQRFLAYYFSPWENPFISFNLQELQDNQKKTIHTLFKKPGIGLNRYPISLETIAKISNNMVIHTFPTLQQPAIVLRGTNLRSVPCDKTSFTVAFADGEGYPFDNWQGSYLTTNEPLCILHQSQDSAWYFVVTGSHCYGWVKREDIAYVTPEFMKKWKTGKYVTPVAEDLPIPGSVFSPLVRMVS